jgi:lysophospholipase L1-like esterase
MSIMKKTILPAIVSLIVALLLTEICLWLFFPIADPYDEFKKSNKLSNRYIESQFQPNQRYVFYPEPDLPGMAESTLFTTNNYGFRGSDIEIPKPAKEYRVFVVGGSTTECLFLDDSTQLTSMLKTYLNDNLPDSLEYKVYNAGKSGDKSYDHLAMISQRIIHLKPDLIIIFSGLNDLTAAIFEKDYTHRQVYDVNPDINFITLTKYFLTQFQIPRRLYNIFQPIFDKPSDEEIQMEIAFKSNYKRLIELRKSHPVSDNTPRIDIESYERNLMSIIGLAQIHEIDLIFMTQAVIWNSQIDKSATDRCWMTYKNGITYREDKLDEALHLYNDLVRQLSVRFNIPVFDLAEQIPKSLRYFYDDCHFNIHGADTSAKLLFDFIKNNLQIQ